MKFSKKEIRFIQKQDVSRVATAYKNQPQVTPIIHVFDGKNIYFATDFDTKKYRNLKRNRKIAIVMDTYRRTPKGITIQGMAEILTKGREFRYAYALLQKRHKYYQANPFEEGEAPVIKIIPIRKASWGIN